MEKKIIEELSEIKRYQFLHWFQSTIFTLGLCILIVGINIKTYIPQIAKKIETTIDVSKDQTPISK